MIKIVGDDLDARRYYSTLIVKTWRALGGTPFQFYERELLRVKDAASLGELPRRGDDIVLTDPRDGRHGVWGVIQVQRHYTTDAGPLGLGMVRIAAAPDRAERAMPRTPWRLEPCLISS